MFKWLKWKQYLVNRMPLTQIYSMNTTRNFTPLIPSTQVFNNPFNRCQLISKLLEHQNCNDYCVYSECRRKREEQRKSDGSWERSRSAVKPSESAEQNREKLPNCGMVGGCHTEGEAKKKTCSHLRGIGVLGGGNGGGVDVVWATLTPSKCCAHCLPKSWCEYKVNKNRNIKSKFRICK